MDKTYYVYVIRNVKTNEILKGARNNNSPYFANEIAALKKCETINNRIKSYSNHSPDDLYKVTKYKLSFVNDLIV